MGGKQSYISDADLDDYQKLTFLSRQEILRVLKRFQQIVPNENQRGNLAQWRVSKKQALEIHELQLNPFRRRIIEVFSSQPDKSITFEDFLDMMSVFSENAPKSVKVAYAFKIYQGIGSKRRPRNEPVSPDAIDIYDIEEIVNRLSGETFSDQQLTKIAEAVIAEVDLRDNKKITAEIFEYFLSNVPDFSTSFIIPLSDRKDNENNYSTALYKSDTPVPTLQRRPQRRRRKNIE